jgi:hypothetical protein
MNNAIEILQALKSAGQRQVSVIPLLQLLQTEDSSRAELLKAQLTFDLEQHKAAFEAANAALKASILINGGAAVAMLALLGNLTKDAPAVTSKIVPMLTITLAWFGGGVLLGAMATGLAYSTQLSYAKNVRLAGISLHLLTTASVVFAYICFAGGLLASLSAFRGTVGA